MTCLGIWGYGMQYTAWDDVQVSQEGWAHRGSSYVKQEGLT